MTKIPSRHGFSLAEVLISVVVSSIALSGLASALFFGLLSGRYADERTLALNYARQMIEIIRISNRDFDPNLAAIGLEDNPGDRRPLQTAPFDGTSAGFAGVTFYDPQFTRNIRVTQGEPNGSLAKIEVTLYWTRNGVERNVQVVAYHAKRL